MNKTRYFVLFDREAMDLVSGSRFWTHRSDDDYVTCFMRNGWKKEVSTYTGSKIEHLLENKIWAEITEAEAALL